MYKIKLNQFEGPLDLLLFFIRRDELDIYDIPISRITKEFIEYLNYLKMLDLELAGDFILMASTLMQIKVRMLLPRELDERGEEIDPRADLIRALLEYKKYKEMAEELTDLESEQRKICFRGYHEGDEREIDFQYGTLLKNITVYDLIKAFKSVLTDQMNKPIHQITKISVTIDEQIDFIIGTLERDGKIRFRKLVEDIKEKIRIIVTFIALLELIKIGRLGLDSTEDMNDFLIYDLAHG